MLDDDEVLGCRSFHGIRCNQSVKGDESALIVYGQGQELDDG